MLSMKLKIPFYAWLFPVFLITNVVHECAHWLVGAAFGQEMVFTLNAIRISSTMVPWQKALMDFAGPLVTICQAVIAYVIVMHSGSHKAFAFLYAAMFMRLVAGIVTVVNPNDEARVSMFLNLGMWTLPPDWSPSLSLPTAASNWAGKTSSCAILQARWPSR